MPLYVPPSIILYADGIHDDTCALQSWVDGDRRVIWQDRRPVGDVITHHRFRIGGDGVPLYIRGGARKTIMYCQFNTGAPMSGAFGHATMVAG